MSEQLDTATFTGAHPTARDLVAQLEVWGFTRRPAQHRTGRGTEGVHLVFRGPRGGTVRVLRSLMGRADAGVVAKAARLVGVDVAQFWAGPASENDPENETGIECVVEAAAVVTALGARRVPASRDRITALVLGVHTTADRPLGFDQVVALCPDMITRDQARSASAVLCRDGQLERIRSGVYQWADGVRAHRLAIPTPEPTRPATRPATAARPAAAAVTSAPPARPACPAPRLSAAELFERLFPHGVRMTAEVLADFEQWAALTEKLTAYADAS